MARRTHLYSTLAALSVATLVSAGAFAQATPAPPPAPAPATTATTQQASAPTPAAAAEPAKPEPDWTFTGNVGLYSQYVFRGLTQTNGDPALQGGFDLGHKSGFYLGTWASNVSWISDFAPGTSASMEWDFYGGYKGSLPADFGYDLGVLYYWYPGTYPYPDQVKPNTTELYAALTWKFLSLKYSYSVNNKTFGIPDSRGSSYIDLTGSYDIAEKVNDAISKVTIFGHLGHQWYTGNTNGASNDILDYGDWKVGISSEIYGVTLGIYGTGTNAQDAPYTPVSTNDNISKGQFVAYIQKTF